MIRYETTGRTGTIILDRPERRNALNGPLVAALKEVLSEAAADDEVRVLVLTGAGASFSAGADLAELEKLAQASPGENLADAQRLAALFEDIALHPKPIVAKVNGAAIGGGCGLMVACDLSVVRADARLGFPEVRLGFVPAVISPFIVRRVGSMMASDLLLRGRLFDGSEAAEMGLVTRCVDAEELDDQVGDLAAELARETSGSALALTKQLLARIPAMPLADALAYGAQINAFARGTDDCKAGVRAFLERREPPWKSFSSET